jgi:hypothetical protein
MSNEGIVCHSLLWTRGINFRQAAAGTFSTFARRRLLGRNILQVHLVAFQRQGRSALWHVAAMRAGEAGKYSITWVGWKSVYLATLSAANIGDAE